MEGGEFEICGWVMGGVGWGWGRRLDAWCWGKGDGDGEVVVDKRGMGWEGAGEREVGEGREVGNGLIGGM